jgi:hypothetical protein
MQNALYFYDIKEKQTFVSDSEKLVRGVQKQMTIRNRREFSSAYTNVMAFWIVNTRIRGCANDG